MPLFVKLDVNWPDDDDVIDVGLDGAGLHAITMCLAKRLETDGWVGRRMLARYGATDELLGRLSEAGLVEVEEGRVRPAGWLKVNPSQAAIGAMRDEKAMAGKRGNHKRWHDGPLADCVRCWGEDSQVVAGSDRSPNRSATPPDRTPRPNRSPETESETDLETETDTTFIGKQLPVVATDATRLPVDVVKAHAAEARAANRGALRSVGVDGTDADRTEPGDAVVCADDVAVQA